MNDKNQSLRICAKKLRLLMEKSVKNYKIKKRHGLPPCGELREGDGIDPRHIKNDDFNPKQNFQNDRLCKQIERVLSLLISGGLQDERFDGLYVDSVKPEPDMSCLMVTVMPVLSDTIPDPDSIKLFLESVKGCLRNEVALEIRRKRMPDFKFRVKIDQDQFNQ